MGRFGWNVADSTSCMLCSMNETADTFESVSGMLLPSCLLLSQRMVCSNLG